MSDRVNRPIDKIDLKWDKPYRFINKLDGSKISELFSDINNMDSFSLKTMSSRHKIPLAVTDEDENTLIHKILENDDKTKNEILRLNLIKFLISEGVNPDSPNKDNVTPLHLACEKQYCEIIYYLLDNGCNPNYQDNYNMTPLHYLLTGNIKICKKQKQIQNFVPLKDNSNEDVKNNFIEIKKELWDVIKDEPIIQSLKNTIKESSKNSHLKMELEKFSKDLNNKINNLDKKKDPTTIIHELIDPVKSAMNEKVLDLFNKFPKCIDIQIHTKENDSWTATNNKNLAIMKNSDNKKLIRSEMKRIVKILTDLIGKNLDLQAGEEGEEEEEKEEKEEDVGEEGEEEEEEEGEKKYRKDILDWENLTLVSVYLNDRDYYLEEDDNSDDGASDGANEDISESDDDSVVGMIGMGGSNIINQKGGSFELNTNNFIFKESDKKLIEDHINKPKFTYINLPEELTEELTEKLTEELTEKLTERRLKLHKATWLDDYLTDNYDEYKYDDRYLTFIKPDDNIDQYENDKKLINTLLLVAALGNEKSDFKLSYIQASRIYKLYEYNNNILTDPANYSEDEYTKINFNMSAWIYLLLSIDDNTMIPLVIEDNSTLINNINPETVPIINQKLFDLIKYSIAYFENENDEAIINKLENDLKWIPSINKNLNIKTSEKLIEGIMIYWNNMPQSPPLQHVVDTISLIRSYNRKQGAMISLLFQYYSNLPSNYREKLSDYLKLIFETDEYDEIEDKYKQTFKKIWDLNNYTLPSKTGYLIYTDNKSEEQIGKYQKALLLGLNYIGNVDKDEIIKNLPPIDGIEDMNDTKIFKEKGKDLLILSNIFKLNNDETNIKMLLYKLIEQLPRKGKNFSKIMPIFYPMLQKINSLQLFYIKLFDTNDDDNNINDDDDDDVKEKKIINNYINDDIIPQLEKAESNNDKIIENINHLNGLYYLYYYIKTKIGNIKIPQFFYYKLPKSNSGKKKFLLFDGEEELKFPPQDIVGTLKEDVTDIKQIDNELKEGSYNYLNTFGYNELDIQLKQEKYFTTQNGGALIRSRTDSLPDSIITNRNIIDLFYHMNIKDIIKNVVTINTEENRDKFNDLVDKTFIKLKINNKEIQKEILLAQTIEELIKNYLFNQIDLLISNEYNKIIAQETDISVDKIDKLFLPQDFALRLNSTDIKLKELESILLPGYLLNFYQFSKDIEKKDQFVIYPNDYTNTNLQKAFWCLEVNTTALEKMIHSGASLTLLDNDEKSPLQSLVKNYYSKPINTLKSIGIDFRSLQLFDKKDKISPLQFMLSEYKNHCFRFLGTLNKKCSDDKLSYYDIMEFFTTSQYEEVKNIIMNNEKFGNNLMQHLDLSFVMANFFIQKYLSVNLFKFDDEYKSEQLLDFAKINSTNNSLDKLIKNNLYTSKVELAQNDDTLIANKLIEVFEEKYSKLDSKRQMKIKENEYLKNLKNLKNSPLIKNLEQINFDKLTDLSTKIKYENNRIKEGNDLANYTMSMPSPNDITKIIPSFDKFIENIRYNRGVYLDGLEQYLRNFIDRHDVIMISNLKHVELKNIFNPNNFDQPTLDKLNNIYPTYKHLSKIAKGYFENPSYLDSNKVLGYFKDVLVHLTQNILCYNIEMIMRKVLYNHFKLMDSFNIVQNINYLFNFERMLEGNYTNMKTILYETIAKKIVMNSVDVFKNQDERDAFNFQTIDEILENYFNLLSISEVFPLKNTDFAMKILKNEIVSYFNTICKNTIENWMVVMENQLKFIINQERIIDCIIQMCKIN